MSAYDYTTSKTWMKTLGLKGRSKAEKENLELLRSCYKQSRDKASILASEIVRVLPFFTRHDISHIDGLWAMTDKLLWGEKKENSKFRDAMLNPAEAFVLGLAFLLHDLGMGLAAYSGGMEGLKNNQFFRDTVADEFRKKEKRSISEKDWEEIDHQLSERKSSSQYEPYIQRALARTLRDLHAENAANLGVQGWATKDNGTVYLIENNDLRDNFGEIAGKIAASHGWGYDKLKKEIGEESFDSGLSGWKVDAQKLACILRVADAMHVDADRADTLLQAVRKMEIDEYSAKHWTFQNKLRSPTVREERLYYQSKKPFKLEDMEAWWLCHDTLLMVDRELRDADTFLMESGRTPFQVRGVYGLLSTEELSHYIKVEGWIPLDTVIRVGDIGKLVSKLGGKQLYGKDSEWVPFREMIQNGADAIRARNKLTGRKDDQGEVWISLYEKDGEQYISFTDNGIGMSRAVLTGPFMDFGQSYWNTPLMYKEWPGLAAAGFESTGQYGIGFYSVFIWSNSVKVITRKYDEARRDTLALEFLDGTNSRPVLRLATEEEQRMIPDAGTCVEIRISKEWAENIRSGEVLRNFVFDDELVPDESDLSERLPNGLLALCPCMDCNLRLYVDHEEVKHPIHGGSLAIANDWLTINPWSLKYRLDGLSFQSGMEPPIFIHSFTENMEQIINNNKQVIGRACIDEDCGRVIVGGFQSQRIEGICGVIWGSSNKADRGSAIPLIDKDTLEKWLNKQLDRIVAMNLDSEQLFRMNELVLRFGFFRNDLPIANIENDYLPYQKVIDYVRKKDADVYIIMNGASDEDFSSTLNSFLIKKLCINSCSFIDTEDKLLLTDDVPRIKTDSPYYTPYYTFDEIVKEAVCKGLNILPEEQEMFVIDGHTFGGSLSHYGFVFAPIGFLISYVIFKNHVPEELTP